jgi:hypothetical protein
MTLKNLAIFMAVYGIALTIAHGEIKNGYDPEVKGMRESLKALTTLLNEDTNLSLFQRAAMKDKINKLVDYISYFELTEELLHQFKNIAPDMYREINSLTDVTGQSVTVFVKFVPENETMRGAAGTTNIAHKEGNRNIYQSEYGPHTVSVKIASVTKSLILLAHEFGHVKYQVENLETYLEYYSAHYKSETFSSTYIGHNSNDLSGQASLEYENHFRVLYINYLNSNNLKPENPFALLHNIQKTLNR